MGDVHVGEVEDDEAVESFWQSGAGEFEEVDVWLVEHGERRKTKDERRNGGAV
jgi:hypothetical protein